MRKAGFAVAVVVLVAGCALLSPQEDDTSSRLDGPEDRVVVPTSEWELGMAAMHAAAEGILTRAPDGCLRVESEYGGTVLVWPQGFYFTEAIAGAADELHGPDGDVVARVGDEIFVGGGYVDAPTTEPHDCVPEGSQAFFVQSDVEATTPPSPLGPVEYRTEPPLIEGPEYPEFVPTARVEGELRLVEDCLLIDRSVVVWPRGSYYSGRRVHVPASVHNPELVIRVGDTVRGGGGWSGHVEGSPLQFGDAANAAIDRCRKRTGAEDAVLVYPHAVG